MKVLIVHAHPEAQSFTAALRDQAVTTLQAQGHEVQVSDLYAMNWNPVASAADFTSRENPEYLVYALEQRLGVKSQSIAPDIQAELDKRGLGADTEIITMCRSGSERGKPSADFLRENGFPNARYVVDGFQGAAIKEGPQAGFRLQNGWQNAGLPWSPKMNPEKIYRTDRK